MDETGSSFIHQTVHLTQVPTDAKSEQENRPNPDRVCTANGPLKGLEPKPHVYLSPVHMYTVTHNHQQARHTHKKKRCNT